jgi:hypothetical protein
MSEKKKQGRYEHKNDFLRGFMDIFSKAEGKLPETKEEIEKNTREILKEPWFELLADNVQEGMRQYIDFHHPGALPKQTKRLPTLEEGNKFRMATLDSPLDPGIHDTLFSYLKDIKSDATLFAVNKDGEVVGKTYFLPNHSGEVERKKESFSKDLNRKGIKDFKVYDTRDVIGAAILSGQVSPLVTLGLINTSEIEDVAYMGGSAGSTTYQKGLDGNKQQYPKIEISQSDRKYDHISTLVHESIHSGHSLAAAYYRDVSDFSFIKPWDEEPSTRSLMNKGFGDPEKDRIPEDIKRDRDIYEGKLEQTPSTIGSYIVGHRDERTREAIVGNAAFRTLSQEMSLQDQARLEQPYSEGP